MTAKELDDLGTDLEAAMPEAVRRKLGINEPTRDADGPGPEFANSVPFIATQTYDQITSFAPMRLR